MDTIWDQIKAKIKDRIPVHCYRMWIEPVVQKDEKGPRIVLQSPNAFSKKRIMAHYGDLIISEIQRMAGFENEVVFEVLESNGCPRARGGPLDDPQMPLPISHPAPTTAGCFVRISLLTSSWWEATTISPIPHPLPWPVPENPSKIPCC